MSAIELTVPDHREINLRIISNRPSKDVMEASSRRDAGDTLVPQSMNIWLAKLNDPVKDTYDFVNEMGMDSS